MPLAEVVTGSAGLPPYPMHLSPTSSQSLAVFLLLPAMIAGCSKLHLGSEPTSSSQLPTSRELERISYMAQASGPDGRRVFDKLDQARSCHDLELAMRWNRPPDVKGGPFNEKMIYLSSGIPSGLPSQSEVFIDGTIQHGQSLSSGGWGWSLKMSDGSELQAIEAAEYWQKQEQEQQGAKTAAIVKPYAPGRRLCGYGIYQGNLGRALNGTGNVPLVSVLFSIDRRR